METMTFYETVENLGVGPKVGTEAILADGSVIVPIRKNVHLRPDGKTFSQFFELLDGRILDIHRLLDTNSRFQITPENQTVSARTVTGFAYFFGRRWKVKVVCNEFTDTLGYEPGLARTYLFIRA